MGFCFLLCSSVGDSVIAFVALALNDLVRRLGARSSIRNFDPAAPRLDRGLIVLTAVRGVLNRTVPEALLKLILVSLMRSGCARSPA